MRPGEGLGLGHPLTTPRYPRQPLPPQRDPLGLTLPWAQGSQGRPMGERRLHGPLAGPGASFPSSRWQMGWGQSLLAREDTGLVGVAGAAKEGQRPLWPGRVPSHLDGGSQAWSLPPLSKGSGQPGRASKCLFSDDICKEKQPPTLLDPVSGMWGGKQLCPSQTLHSPWWGQGPGGSRAQRYSLGRHRPLRLERGSQALGSVPGLTVSPVGCRHHPPSLGPAGQTPAGTACLG